MSLLVLGAGLALAGPAVALEQTVTFPNGGPGSYSYSPASPAIKTGDRLTFSGNFTSHPLVWDAGEPPLVADTGSSRSYRFAQSGTYAFRCALHGGPPNNMAGSVTVTLDQHATVSFGVSPSPRAGQPVTFTYTGSADPDGTLTAWKWDLDGDGSFETATPTGAATTTYATARTVTVSMIAVDDSGEDSAVAQQAVTIAAGSGGSGGAGAPGTGASGTDTIAPRATLIRLRGLKLSFRASERASATATLRARGRTIAKGSAKAKSGAISIRLKLTSAGRSVLRPGRKLKATLTLTLRDSAGNRRSVKKALTVRRR
jgi:PKD repeat protein